MGGGWGARPCSPAPVPPAASRAGGWAGTALRNLASAAPLGLFLELEPQVRDIIFKFYESKYASCLKMLDEMVGAWPGLAGRGWAEVQKAWGKLSLIGCPRQDNLLLDMYLAPHVRTLYTQIRNRALIQVSILVEAEAKAGALRKASLGNSCPPLLCSISSPYVSADMRKMATFNTTVASAGG